MSKNNKGMICLLHSWESENLQKGISPDCRNHRHMSRRRACETFSDARLADNILARVFDANYNHIGFVVQIAKRVLWASNFGDARKPELKIGPSCWQTINAHLNRFQASLDSGESIQYSEIRLKEAAGKIRTPSRNAAIAETIKSYSPCAITAKESELNAECALAKKRSEHRQTT